MNKLYPSLSRFILADPEATTIDLQRSHGSWLVDENGKERLDLFSQYASQPLGWNHPLVHEQRDRLYRVVEHNIANPDMYTREYCDFVELFSTFCPDFKHFFFISGGCLGVENSLKAAFDWKGKRLGVTPDMPADYHTFDVFHFKDSFNGRSGYSLSLTNTTPDKTSLFPTFPWSRFPSPKVGDNTEIVEKQVVDGMIACFERKSKLGEPNVAAILIETITGEGGNHTFRPEFFKSLRQLADKYHAMLILDEVQCGMAISGKVWAYEHFGIIPDMICFGKKVQACGFACTNRIDEIKDNVFKVKSRINSTWGASITDMVRSTIFMEIIRSQNLVENAAVVGDYFKAKLKSIGLKNVRGYGLMLGFDLDNKEQRDAFLKKINEKAVVIKCGEKSIRVRPHLTFSKEEVDIAIDFIKQSL